MKEQWDVEGYAVVPGIYNKEITVRLLPVCEAILEQWRKESAEDGKPGGGPQATVMRHLNHPGYFKMHPEWKKLILESVADKRVLDVAREVLGEEPMFRTTSFFFNPIGTSRDGNWHRDSQFRHHDEKEEKAFLERRFGTTSGIQMQIALTPSEDIEYVPRSHLRWDTPEEYHIRRADEQKNNTSNVMPGAIRLKQEPGDAVLFNPLGLHRGRYHTDKRRRTYMLTYMPASAHCIDYFSHQPWFLTTGYLDGLTRSSMLFFERFIDKYRKDWTGAAVK
mgnify:FL=1